MITGYQCGERESRARAFIIGRGQITSGQVSKVVANTFFPECQPVPLR